MSEKRRVNKMMDQSTWEALKAAGYSEAELLAEQPFGPILSSYTRRQAIADGVLVDLMQSETQSLLRQAGFKIPMAMTVGAFGAAICPIDGQLPPGQDLKGRLWDILWMFRTEARRCRGDTLLFEVLVRNNNRMPKAVTLKAVCGPDDEGAPCITIMNVDQD